MGNKPCLRADKPAALAVCIWRIAFISGLLLWIVEWRVKPALFKPYVVVPCSIMLYLESILSRFEAFISEYNKPNGLM